MTPQIILLAAFMAGAFFLVKVQLDTVGSGAGDIGTDDAGEGQGLDGLLTQAINLVPFAGTGAGQLSFDGLDKLKTREGFSATAYPDHKGYSIGYGHLIRAGDGLDRYSRITQAQALQLLASDVAWALAAVNKAIRVALTQSQFDALVSFTYNVGAGAFASSTLVKRINAGDSAASDEFSRWVYASGQRNAALVTRRASETQQFESDEA